MKSKKEYGYNERLFDSGLRRRLHLARFQWCSNEISRLGCPQESVFELGCFDGKLIDFLPKKPRRYKGFDANWESGLDLARKKWGDEPNYSFFKALSAEEINLKPEENYDIAVVMETLEHVPPSLVSPYLKKIASHLKGYLFVTVPNEKGFLFLAKWVAKKIFSRDAEKYTLFELWNAFLGRMHLVQRREHKGFDYRSLISEIEEHFDIVRVSGHPFGFLPVWLCFGVGIVARSKRLAVR